MVICVFKGSRREVCAQCSSRSVPSPTALQLDGAGETWEEIIKPLHNQVVRRPARTAWLRIAGQAV